MTLDEIVEVARALAEERLSANIGLRFGCIGRQAVDARDPRPASSAA